MGADVSAPLISRRAADALTVVERFFGIDHEWNRHIFGRAVSADARAFETTICAMAEAIHQDSRFGTTERIRRSIAQEKARR